MYYVQQVLTSFPCKASYWLNHSLQSMTKKGKATGKCSLSHRQNFRSSKSTKHVGVTGFKAINWLPTKNRVDLHTCVNIMKFFKGTSPAYAKILQAVSTRLSTRSRKIFSKIFRERKKASMYFTTIAHRHSHTRSMLLFIYYLQTSLKGPLWK